MRRASLCLLSGGILTALVLCAAGASSGPGKESSEVEQLRKEIAELRQRVQSLEDRMRDHSIVVPRGGRGRSIITIPPGLPSRPVPNDWRPFEFNGMTYYVVPIDEAPKSAVPVDPNK